MQNVFLPGSTGRKSMVQLQAGVPLSAAPGRLNVTAPETLSGVVHPHQMLLAKAKAARNAAKRKGKLLYFPSGEGKSGEKCGEEERYTMLIYLE
jgi:hypothetical protein